MLKVYYATIVVNKENVLTMFFRTRTVIMIKHGRDTIQVRWKKFITLR